MKTRTSPILSRTRTTTRIIIRTTTRTAIVAEKSKKRLYENRTGVLLLILKKGELFGSIGKNRKNSCKRGIADIPGKLKIDKKSAARHKL